MERKVIKTLISLLLAVMMMLSTVGNVFAVTGSTVAADGTYSGYSSEGTVTVNVSNGKIASVSANAKSKYQSYISSAFSSVVGKAATANNIDAVSAATKHMSAIKSGAKSAIASAPSADGSDDSSYGNGSGSNPAATDTTEFIVEINGTQELSVTSDELWSYSWSSSETSKVSVNGNGNTAVVTGKAVTDTPVTVTCTYGLSGIMTVTKDYKFTVVSGGNEELGQGVGSKSGTKYTGTAYVNGDTEDEWVTLDVYVSDGQIAGVFIAAEDGSWLNLLSAIKDNFLGKEAAASAVDAVSSATTLGFRDTIRNAVSDALSEVEEDTVKAPEITNGSGSTWTKGTSSTLSFTSDAEYSDFLGVKVDGNAVSSGGYTVSSGSTVVVLNSSYLESLSTGGHSISIVSANGTASGTFTVAAAADNGSGSGTSGNNSSDNSYTGTIVNALTDGDYIIADRYSSSYSYYALSNTTVGSSGSGYGYAGESVTVSGNTATVTSNKAVWTWNSGNNSFYNVASGKYLALPSSTYTAAAFFSDSPAALKIHSVSGNEATVYNPSGNGGYYLNAAYPSGGKAFSSSYARYMNSSYLSTGSGVYFYKIEGTSEQASTISLNPTSLSLELGGSGDVTATVDGCTISAVSSSDEDVAAAIFSGNKITVRGIAAGTAVFTVTGTASSGYAAPDSVTFSVTVASGSTGGNGPGGGTMTTTPGNPKYEKSIAPENEVAEEYTISLNVTADDLESATTTPGTPAQSGKNLVIVIDVSGSIVGKEAALNSAIQSLVQGLPENSQVGVVTFNESASASRIYTPATISGLSFSGVANAGTNMAAGISAATSLLNGSGWAITSNGKVMVIISDFDIDDYSDSINNAKAAKESGTTIYSVKVDSSNVSAADRTDLSTDYREGSIPCVVRYISSQYPSASAVNNSLFGMFNQADVTPGSEDNSAAYVYGAAGGSWSEIFAEIKATEGITEETTEPMKNVVITDTLSDYVELTGPAPDYGITLYSTDSAVTLGSVAVTGKEVKVSLNGELTDGTTYTVKIPVKPTELAQTEANQKFTATTNFKSNASATMTYEYDEQNTGAVTYAEEPEIVVAKKVKLTYDAGAADDDVTGMPEELSEEKAVGENVTALFSITTATPERTGRTFLGWNTDKGASEADESYTAGAEVSLGADTILYAIWEEDTVILTYDKNTEDDAAGMPDAVEVTKGGEVTISDAVPEREGCTFLGWADSTDAQAAVYEAGDDLEMTENKTIYAVWRQDYRLIFEDYTRGGVTIKGVETAVLEDHPDCRIGTTYVNGEVAFTLSADMAVVAAIHTDSAGMNYDKLMNEDGNYERLYCTEGHQFTVNTSNGDVYIVLAYKGDVNLDGEIEIWDSTLANRIYLETWQNITNIKRLIGDVDADGEIEIWDSTLISRVYVDTYTIMWDVKN